jgi:Fe-S-cluster containining protein
MENPKKHNTEAVHPCLTCGACCAYFRVSFHPSENSSESLEVPISLSVSVDAETSVMKGTDTLQNTRCVALSGTVGKNGSCSIYENRPSPCRKFEASYERGVKEPRCDEARKAYQLAPLTLQDYDGIRNKRG